MKKSPPKEDGFNFFGTKPKTGFPPVNLSKFIYEFAPGFSSLPEESRSCF